MLREINTKRWKMVEERRALQIAELGYPTTFLPDRSSCLKRRKFMKNEISDWKVVMEKGGFPSATVSGLTKSEINEDLEVLGLITKPPAAAPTAPPSRKKHQSTHKPSNTTNDSIPKSSPARTRDASIPQGNDEKSSGIVTIPRSVETIPANLQQYQQPHHHPHHYGQHQHGYQHHHHSSSPPQPHPHSPPYSQHHHYPIHLPPPPIHHPPTSSSAAAAAAAAGIPPPYLSTDIRVDGETLRCNGHAFRKSNKVYLHDNGSKLSVKIVGITSSELSVQRTDGSKTKIPLEVLGEGRMWLQPKGNG
ncbi:uncharacterized protein EV422DRAFT_249248 [Fimicolochytrium jonesii]|uniref:uncharacterized protein n=1 Tax=Fimicolochytrium jonesii TaxID=1396493 RepID=UPI0022FDEF76|nr:uncharacterized protein EV422DRAFT_249248 [Fimicolochytrium jonesii]KAI8825187.1 hypothetical protein EV422DRAFT_249248 [Fimicolochytrium jonesii]